MRPIFLILFFALLLRLWGITYGFPLFLVNDEPAFVLGALKMIELKTLVPAWHTEEFRKVLYYPPFLSYFYLVALAPVLGVHYLLSGAPPLATYQDAFTLDPSFLWVAARILNASLGLGVIFLAYRITRNVAASERAALLAALFLAVSFYHIQLSQVVRHWMPATLLIYGAWFAALSFRTDQWRPYLTAGILAGLAVGVNTSSVIVFVPLLLYHFANNGTPFSKKAAAPRLWLAAGLAAVIAVLSALLYPYGFTRAEGGGSVGGDLLMRFGFIADKTFSGWLAFLADYAGLLIRYEPALLTASLLGAILLLRRNQLYVGSALLFSVLYLSLLYLFFNAIPRALIFILPALAVLAGFGLDRLMLALQNRLRPNSAAVLLLPAVLGLLFFAYPLIIDLRYDYLMSRPDTRLVAQNWIEKNIPAGAKILADSEHLRLTNTKDGIRELARLDPSGLRALDRVLLRYADAKYPSPAFTVLNLHFISPTVPERSIFPADYFRERGYQYLVVEYESVSQADLEPHTRDLVRGLRLIKRFEPFGSKRFEYSLDVSGEIASVRPLDLFTFERFGEIVAVYKF